MPRLLALWRFPKPVVANGPLAPGDWPIVRQSHETIGLSELILGAGNKGGHRLLASVFPPYVC
jgi:hypothetical protein